MMKRLVFMLLVCGLAVPACSPALATPQPALTDTPQPTLTATPDPTFTPTPHPDADRVVREARERLVLLLSGGTFWGEEAWDICVGFRGQLAGGEVRVGDWWARHESSTKWVVGFEYWARGYRQEARFEWDDAFGKLASLNEAAHWWLEW